MPHFSSGIPTAMEAAPIPEEHVEGADPLYEDEERPSNDFQFSSGVPAAADVAPEPQVVEEPIMEPHEEAFGANQQEEQDYNDFRFSSGAPERNVVAPNVEPVEPSGSDPIKPDTSNDEDGQTVNPNAASGFPIQSTYEPMDRTGESETFPGDYRSFSASVPGELRAASQLEMTNSHYFGSSTDGVEYNTKDRSSNSLDHVAASQNDVDPPTMPIYNQREEHPTEHTEVVVSTGEETREESARPEVNPEDEEMRKSFSAFVSKMRSQREASVNHANFRTYEEFSAEVTENMAKADNYFISMSDPRDGNFRPHQNSIFQFSYRFSPVTSMYRRCSFYFFSSAG
ncbi:hypothetical protein AGDE_15202 [Angomonas deanei]|nr:hypothetical protein AGDE_15202 [Angomonas deanei]|eukprot:EPY19530.1 hypothetical protein AGDE_15202 [Angomonas deanei]